MSTATCTRIPVDKLVVDGRYQRPVQSQRVERIVREFDAKLLGTLELSERKNGTFAIIDGQHRYEAVRLVGRKTVPALVHKGLTPKEEADLFARTNMGRKPLTPIQRFRAQVFAGDPDAVALANIITNNGFKVDYSETSQALGVIRGIVTLENAYKQHGADHVNMMLDVVRDLWFGEGAATDNNLLRGMSEFLIAYGDRFEEKHRERLRRTPAMTIVRRAKEKTITDSRTAIAGLIADDLRRLSGLRGAPAAPKQRDDAELSELVAADA